MSVCPCVTKRDISIYLHRMYDVLDHTNHVFSESLSSGDDNDRDEYLQKTNTKTKTHTHRHKDNTKCFQDPLYAICIKISGFKDLKYYIGRNGPKMHFWSISEPPGGPWGQFWCVQMAPTDHLRCIPPRSNQDPLRSSHLDSGAIWAA